MPAGSGMQNRRGTAAEWANANPVLKAGEIGFETDTLIFKMGDGVTSWNNLSAPFLSVNGKAADSDKLDGLNSTEFLRTTDETLARYLGSGNAFPTADLTIGDLFQHTGLKSLMRYHGAQWRQIEPAVMTLAERTAMETAYASILYRGFKAVTDGWLYEYEPTIVGGIQNKWVRPGVWIDAQLSAATYNWTIPVSATPLVWPKLSGPGADASFQIYVPTGRTLEVAWEIPSVEIASASNMYLRLISTDGGVHGGKYFSSAVNVPYQIPDFFSTQILGTEKLITVTPQGWCSGGSAKIKSDSTSGALTRLKYRFVKDQV